MNCKLLNLNALTGKGYNEAYLLCPKPEPPPKLSEETLARTFQNILPMADGSSSDEETNGHEI
jgi:hypothetical protein